LIQQFYAQRTVNFSGQIKNTNPNETVYLGLNGPLLALDLKGDGTFSIDNTLDQVPSFFYVATISKRGKIESQTPLIWFENDQIEMVMDWSTKELHIENFMHYQSLSETIEKADEKEGLALILKNQDAIPSLYFAEQRKEQFATSDLETYFNSIGEESKNTIYAKKIERYLLAKNKPSLKKGSLVENFTLPNEKGEPIDVLKGNNKLQVIAIFSSGCPYSIASISLLKQLSDLNNNKINIVSIWDDETKAIWLNSYKAQKSDITWTNLWDEYGFASTYFKPTSWPTFYVLNENGELTKILKGYDKKTAKELKQLIE
jgi:hypothetical protein